MDNRRNLPSTYVQAGFNGFLRRTIGSNGAMSLRQSSSDFRKVNNPAINFDESQTTGALGDTIKVGSILIDGKTGRISVFDGTNEVVRIGELDD